MNASIDLRLPREIVEAYPPNENRLLTVLCQRTTDEMLWAVARGDYDNNTDDNFKALKRIQQGLDWEKPRQWVPREVLNLFKWSTLDHPHVLSDPSTFHIARAFCCAVLLRVPDQHNNEGEYDNNALAPLIDSALFLGSEIVHPLIGHMVWMLERMAFEEEDYLFHAFGIFVLFRLSGMDSAQSSAIGQWLVRANRQLMPTYDCMFKGNGRTFMDLRLSSISQEKWRNFAKLLKAKGPFDPLVDSFIGDVIRSKTWFGI